MHKINRSSSLFLVAIVFLFSFGAKAQVNLDQSFGHVFEGLTGTISTVIRQPDNKILAGGLFFFANTNTRASIARFNSDGTLDDSFSPSLGTFPNGVRSIVALPDGKILVGGNFVTPGSPDAKNIVRLNSDGSEDMSFTGFTNGTVFAIAAQNDGKILIGGSFTTVNNISRFGAARLNANGTLDATFTFAARTVFAIAILSDGNILLGGSFVLTSPTTVNRIVRVSPTGAIDTAFSASASVDNTVRAIKVHPNTQKILLGGQFANVNGVFHNALARLNPDGTLDTGFGPVVTGNTTIVEGLDIDATGRIYVGGTFTGIDGTPCANVARLYENGSLDTGFVQQAFADQPVRAVLAGTFGTALVAGDFRNFGGLQKFRIALLRDDGTSEPLFPAAVYSNTFISDAKVQPDGRILVAGNFQYIDGVRYSSFVRLNSDGTIDSSFTNWAQLQIFANEINDIELQPDGKILLCGSIVLSNGVAYGVVRLNSNGTVDATFAPVTISSRVNVVRVLPNGQILVGGSFSTVNSTPRTGLAKLSADGTLDATFNPNILAVTSIEITALSVRADGEFFVCGYFSTINGVPKNNLAVMNQSGTLDTSFTASVSDTVYSLAELPGGSVVITGTFASVNGVSRNKIAKLNSNGELDANFNIAPSLNPPWFGVKALEGGLIALFGDGIYQNLRPNNLVILNADGSSRSVLSNSQWFNDNIYDLEVDTTGKLIVAGAFSRIGGVVKFGLARFSSLRFATKTALDFDGDGKTDVGVFRPAPGEWWINRSSNASTLAAQFGNSSDMPVPTDFTGDGKADVAFWRPTTGEWFVLRSENGSFYSFPFGSAGDIPVVGDFDADGKSDAGVFRPSTGTWFVAKSSGGTLIQQFGTVGDLPVVADYDGDGKSDVAIYRPVVGEWWIVKSSNATVAAFQFGSATDKAVPGDFTGDGKADAAFYRPSTGNWFVLRSEDSSFYSFPFGTSGDLAVPGDYDGDGKFDAGVFRPSESNWYVNRSSAGILIVGFGAAGDAPLPNSFVR